MEPRTIFIGSGTARTGEAVITAFLKAGYRVAATSRSRKQLESTLSRVPHGDTVLPIEADLSQPQDAEAALHQTCAAFGRLDAATLLSGSFDQREVVDTSLADFQHQIEANLYTTYNLVRAVLPVMLDQGRGNIITIAGGSGLDPAPGRALFGASKAAVITFMKGVARDYKQRGIVPTCLVAGAIATAEAKGYLDAEDFRNAVTLDEFANALVFLASPEASGFAGSILELYAREVD
ncbi:MAG: SDR family NAD(P)-dependent oxidoreductase [Chloroflexota bacterium]|nr:SDR family NAD(P)-dependent oxidoreductase [Chloroflexota bacterium]MDE2839333.1 SDR family NAD(P)-dependent oxidoreductase [Chloroflexota bacterium]